MLDIGLRRRIGLRAVMTPGGRNKVVGLVMRGKMEWRRVGGEGGEYKECTDLVKTVLELG